MSILQSFFIKLGMLAMTMGGALNVWAIYAVIFAGGMARSFVRPAISALGAEVVRREIYPNAVAWRTSDVHAGLQPALNALVTSMELMAYTVV